MSKPILFMFGGVSAEHEVSVVTGLQALENVPRSEYNPLPIYVSKKGELFAMPDLTSRKQFLTAARKEVSFSRDHKGGFVSFGGFSNKKVYPYAAFLAFHGGTGEAGPTQGMLELLGIPFTSSGVEGSVIAMNKRLTKECLRHESVSVVPDVRFFSHEILADTAGARTKAIEALGLPAIVKPVHLGSSIGLTVAHTEVELEKGLLSAAHLDSEILVEPFLAGIVEYNCAVRRINGTIEVSEIERPVSNDEILSFADKYERGSKKGSSGMASLDRELPAKISPELKSTIQENAKKAFLATRLKGMARIDFMKDTNGTLFLTEINPIPGSLSFYLWEASGIPFEKQISALLEQAVADAQDATHNLDYTSDIIEKFVQGG